MTQDGGTERIIPSDSDTIVEEIWVCECRYLEIGTDDTCRRCKKKMDKCGWIESTEQIKHG